MTEDTLILNVPLILISRILTEHKSKNFSQCGKCSSVNAELRELAITLNNIYNENIDSDDEMALDFGEDCIELLERMIDIGYHEDCFRNEEFTYTWFEENEFRFSQKLTDDFCEAVYFKPFKDVVLKTDNKCDCYSVCNKQVE